MYNGAGPLPGEGVLSVIDVQKFSKEVVDEVKARFPERFSEDAEIASSLLSLIAVVAATAIAKYEKERGVDVFPDLFEKSAELNKLTLFAL